MRLIKKNQEEIQGKSEGEELLVLLHRQVQLNEAKKAIANELGRIVLK